MAGFFSPATLEQIRSASDIVDVIGAYIPLKRAGANFTALCPFHKEKTPSFNVNPQKQIFHCFGCHKGGDVFTFVKEYENIDFPDAVRRLADRAKIPLQVDNNPLQQQSRHIKDALLQIHEQITQRWQNALANEASAQPARDYLATRGVSAEAVKLFRLGYAPDLWDDTVNWAKSKGHELTLVEQGGLILRKEGAESHYDRFRGRLIFPICDEQGRVIGFSGRVLDPEAKTAKYVNSPETPIFTKGKVFFGLDKSKRALLDAESAIICEGQLDLIACYMSGIQNVVAPQGTALTGEHARILERYVSEVVLCFDSDEAGQNATMRSLDNLMESDMARAAVASLLPEMLSLQGILSKGIAVKVAVVPAPHDPDSFIKSNGADAFRGLIKKADDFFDYYLTRLCKKNDVSTDKGRLAVLQRMAEVISQAGNEVVKDTYARRTALRLGVPPEAVLAEFRKVSRSKKPTPARFQEPEVDTQTSAEPKTAPPSVGEYWLIKLLLRHEDMIHWVRGHLNLEWIQHSHVQHIVASLLTAHSNDTWQGVAGLLAECESSELRNFITEATMEDRAIHNPQQQLIDIATRLRNQFIDKQIIALGHRANQPGTREEDHLDLLRQQQALRQSKKQPLAPLTGDSSEPF